MDLLKSKQPTDVVYIFSDINMPGMSGFELLEKVRIQFPQIDVSMILGVRRLRKLQECDQLRPKFH